MNIWTAESIDLANTKDYLDQLFQVYPMSKNEERPLDASTWAAVEAAYQAHDHAALLTALMPLSLFPIKDSYVAFLRTDPSALARNPDTVKRLGLLLHDFTLEELYKRCSQPKETNRQIGNMFGKWLSEKALGIPELTPQEFANSAGDGVLLGNDNALLDAAKQWGYIDSKNKGLDFVCRFRGNKIIGEAKFLSAYGGNQNNQFKDALRVVQSTTAPDVVKLAILDGVVYIKKPLQQAGTTAADVNNYGYPYLVSHAENHKIMSALVLRDFLFSLPKK